MPIPSSQRARPAAAIRPLLAREDYENAFSRFAAKRLGPSPQAPHPFPEDYENAFSRFAAKRLGPSPQAPHPFPSALLSGEKSGERGDSATKDKWRVYSLFILSIEIIFKICVNRPWSVSTLKKMKREGGGTAPPGPKRAEKLRFFRETTGRMV